MKERPIIFNTEMVCATLEGRKNNTRRVMKPQPDDNWRPYSYGEVHKMYDGEFVLKHGDPIVIGWGASNHDGDEAYPCPYGQPGDRLWVRETFAFNYWKDVFLEHPYYKADENHPDGVKWRPSIHMPRHVSRITLEITGIRAERLQSITGEDACREGFCKKEALIQELDLRTALHDFVETWDDIYAKSGYGWFANPWVWVIDFKRIES